MVGEFVTNENISKVFWFRFSLIFDMVGIIGDLNDNCEREF